jgi:hypothetical protein
MIIVFQLIPNELIISKISSLLKKGKIKSEIESYRSFSVQPNIYRISEIILLSKLNPFIILNKLILKQQYSYTKGISIFHQHIDLQNLIYEYLNDKAVKCVDLVFLDLSSAFDLVPHDRLLEKLNSFVITGDFLKILKSNFVNRKLFVRYIDKNSIKTIKKGE